MLKILVVDDEQEKSRLIIEVISGVSGISFDNIEQAYDCHSAKIKLREKHYDLVVLDINLPLKPSLPPQPDGGAEVLRFIRKNLGVKQPRYVVGLTAYDEAFEGAEDSFDSVIFKIVKFNYADVQWRDSLESSVNYLVSLDKPPYPNDGITYHCDVAIVCALDEELKAILEFDGGWRQVIVDHDHSNYFRTSLVINDDVTLDVVAVSSPQMGMPAAGVVTSRLITNFRPKLLVMSGICAGVRGKSNFGDVLVADPCFDYGSGKWVSDPSSSELSFRPAPYPFRLNHCINRIISRLSGLKGIGEEIADGFEGERPEDVPRIIMNAMASGGSVLQARSLMQGVIAQHKNLIGIEMESYAVFAAAEYSGDPAPMCISIKSVCDFGDEDKDDRFHKFACHTSAKFVYRFLNEWSSS
ncbi:hypothetical protein ACJJI5_16290 [Microbulbifer sp. EKSA008]|uniref:phosphorylase family protein n=1 Tax=Microbulbifer sp. EKSA008 TaxID=3243367 RepID=UPI004041455F